MVWPSVVPDDEHIFVDFVVDGVLDSQSNSLYSQIVSIIVCCFDNWLHPDHPVCDVNLAAD